MYAITVPEPGGPENMHWTEVEDPKAGPGEVVLDVAASAVNRADLLQREGNYPPPPGASEIIGLECSGVISQVGDGVSGWSVGDSVCALLTGGGYATKVAVPAAQLLPVPQGIDLVTAASLPEVACTVFSNVVSFAGLAAGQTLLVQGGSSGIGTHAIQVGKALGARVAVTANPARFDVCRELGADIVLDYAGDFATELKEATDGRGADVVLDNMGAKGLKANVSALAPDGRLMVIGMQGGVKAELNIGALLAKRASVTAMGLRGRPVDGPQGKGEVVRGVRERIWPLVADGRVRPVVHGRFRLQDAADAHRTLAAGGVVGKLVLVAP
ncbi:NAD(P)H-quinone oxidoreductase [Pseudonocardia ailaonensis]|uniref:NAD(P)H-quinone oxidoreductase n=1 Tax=Pseudonocardia ailaonensis TaxID=367279 RepID=A0ABN2NJV4_9PSEU